jgi:hypothetical protein
MAAYCENNIFIKISVRRFKFITTNRNVYMERKTHTHTHTHTRTRARAHAHTHTHTLARAGATHGNAVLQQCSGRDLNLRSRSSNVEGPTLFRVIAAE